MGRIFIKKSELENNVTDIINVWKDNDSTLNELKKEFEKRNINVKVSKNESTSFITIEVSDKVSFITPFLKTHKLKVKRVLPLE